MDRRTYLSGLAGGVMWLSGCGSDEESVTSETDSVTEGEATRSIAGTTESENPELPDPLRVNRTNPFFYSNDIPTDNFNGELALAMASDAEGIDLRGYLHEFPVVPWWDDTQKYQRTRERYVRHHQRCWRKAEQSGFSTLPPVEYGLYQRHEKPDSGAIGDTTPIGSAGTDAIVEAANSATREKPLVIAVGGPLCTVADAYLTDPSIRDKVIVFWRFRREGGEWNEFLSGWSATVVTRRLATVFCPAKGGPLVRESRVKMEFPDEPLKQYMLTKVYDGTGENPLAGGQKWEGDAISILSPAHPETRTGAEYLQFSGLKSHWAIGEVLPSFQTTNERTSTLIIPEHKHEKMNEAWWSHMKASSTWGET